MKWARRRDAARDAAEAARLAAEASPDDVELKSAHRRAVDYAALFTQPKAGAVTKTWGTYEDIVEKILGPNRFVRIECKDGVPDPEKIDTACTKDPNICWLLYCNPNNPTGKQMPADVAANLCFVVARHDLFVHEDAIYASKSFKHAHRSILRAAASLLANEATRQVATFVAQHTTLAIGWGKFGLSGGRHYCCIIPYLPLRKRYVGVQGALYGPAPSLSQRIVLEMVMDGGDVRNWKAINDKRVALCDSITSMADQLRPWGINLEWTGLEGGFYTWLRFVGVAGLKYTNRLGRDKVLDTSEQFFLMLIEKAGLVASPDKAALTDDPEGLRIAFGTMTLEHIELMAQQVPAALIAICEANGRSASPVHAVEPAAG